MSPSARSLRFSARAASALGLISVSLTGEISLPWLVSSWLAWTFSLFSDHYPNFGSSVRKLETLAVFGMIAMLLVDFFLLHNSIFIAVTHFLLLFQIVKLIGEKARKDCLQMFLFSFFQILAACTLSVDAWHAAVLLALIPTATAALFWNQMEFESERANDTTNAAAYPHYRGMAALICSIALPLNVILTLVVFVLFPRLTFNASLPGFSGRRSGYTDQMNLAQKGSLSQDTSVVLWLSFPKPDERAKWNGYLRGEVLDQFNGKEWSVSRNRRTRMVAADWNGIFIFRSQIPKLPLIHQSVTLADTSASTLFTIDKPIRIVSPLPAIEESQGGSLHWAASWHRPLKYEVVSQALLDTALSPDDLSLPKIPLEKIKALTNQIAGKGPAAAQARQIEQYLQKNYRYTFSYGDHVADNPVDHFLFESREGMCGHFASAMALMLRLHHIPSRVVAGYLKGEWNEPAECVVVRERDAHAWVEAYIEGQGWISFDPSPQAEIGLAGRQRNLLHLIAQYADYFDLQWNRFVIQYDLYSQIKAFENMKESSGRFGNTLASWWSKTQARFHHSKTAHESSAETETSQTYFPWKKCALVVALGLLSASLLFRKRTPESLAAIRFYAQFLDRMAKEGHGKAPNETGWEFARRLARENPEQADLSRCVTEKYYDLRFSKGTL